MSDRSYGVSFSAKYAREMDIDPRKAYMAMLLELKFSRVRLMSYWDEIETAPAVYDFKELDWQIKQASKYGVMVTLCLGMRQPRWPECHVPEWAKKLDRAERHKSLYSFLEKVVSRYKDQQIIESWQLENEALNRGIGICDDYDRKRLRREYRIVKNLDTKRPIIMSTSNTYGFPVRRPRPDIVGFSVYLSQHRKNKYYFSKLPAWWHRMRKWLIIILLRKAVIIHELQGEPWGGEATHKLSQAEQAKSMDAKKLASNIVYAHKTGIQHIDLWGVEWWYWQKTTQHNRTCWDLIKDLTS